MKTIVLALVLFPAIYLQSFKGDTNSSSPISQTYVYAELVYQRNFGSDTFWVSGSSVSESTRGLVQKVKYSVEALNALGSDGWELKSTVTRNFDGGFEIYYYLEKEIK